MQWLNFHVDSRLRLLRWSLDGLEVVQGDGSSPWIAWNIERRHFLLLIPFVQRPLADLPDDC